MNDPRTWVPYMNTRDCSQGFCTLYCPQWCYIIFPPPPPFHFFEVNNNNNNNPSSPSPNFSPLVIAIIGVLVSAFLLVTYYAIMSKNSWNRNVSRRDINHLHNQEDTSIHESGQASNGGGLDETLIKSIATFKYKKGDRRHGVMDGYDCSVCLGEFQEDETLRLLPKCNHAFHVTCIDTWLKSHSNCPLCRSNIVVSNPSPPHPILDSPPRNESLISPQSHAYHGREEEGTSNRNDLDFPTLIKEFNHSYSGDVGHSSAEEQNQEAMRRRCASMDFSCQAGRLSIADILRIDNEGECCGVQDYQMDNGIGPSKHHEEELVSRRNSHRHSVLSCVMSPSVINYRSFSSERFLFPKLKRGPNTILPF